MPVRCGERLSHLHLAQCGLFLTDSVEKVGHGLRIGKVRVRD